MISLGLEIALQLSEADQIELRAMFVKRLGDAYPGDPRVREVVDELNTAN
ncbi:MAG: hypothetical protein AB7P03_03535 [Kofleriaceae bacterium]